MMLFGTLSCFAALVSGGRMGEKAPLSVPRGLTPLTAVSSVGPSGTVALSGAVSRVGSHALAMDTTDVLLTADALTQMTTFWTAFLQLPDSGLRQGRAANTYQLPVDVGEGDPVRMTVVDMQAMAAHFPAVDTVLQQTHLTATRWEQYRLALFAALIAHKRAVSPPPSSLLGRNITFLQAHAKELAALRATNMWFPPQADPPVLSAPTQ